VAAHLTLRRGPKLSAATLDRVVIGNPTQPIVDAVEDILSLAESWLAWGGRGLTGRDEDGVVNVWTPHKALRRVTDHLLDHLQEVEALLVGTEPMADGWHGRMATLDADWARFTEIDLENARQRLRRIARTYLLRYRAAGPEEWDRPRGDARTLRAIAEHVAQVRWYAEQVGRLE
jgi:hypothetical protein